jgi:hypothetical protein
MRPGYATEVSGAVPSRAVAAVGDQPGTPAGGSGGSLASHKHRFGAPHGRRSRQRFTRKRSDCDSQFNLYHKGGHTYSWPASPECLGWTRISSYRADLIF